MVDLHPGEEHLKLISPWRIKVVDEASNVVRKLLNQGLKKVNVLEVGCDNAVVSLNLKKKFGDNVNVTGIDVREEEFADGIALSKKHNLDVNFRQALFLELKPEQEEKFDIIIFSEVYEHLLAEKQMLSLRVLGGLLSADGHLIMTVPNGNYVKAAERRGNCFNTKYKPGFFDNLQQTGHWREPSKKELDSILVSLGFDIKKSGYFNLPFSGRTSLGTNLSKSLEPVGCYVPFASLVWKNLLVVAQKNEASPFLNAMN